MGGKGGEGERGKRGEGEEGERGKRRKKSEVGKEKGGGRGKGSMPPYPGGPCSSLKVTEVRVEEGEGILALRRMSLSI